MRTVPQLEKQRSQPQDLFGNRGIADLKYDFLIVWRTERATQSKNHIWIKQRRDGEGGAVRFPVFT
jgi:hypothetical protein